MKRTFFLLSALLLLSGLEPLAAQFEGQITFRAYEPGEIDRPERVMQIYLTPERILLQSQDRYRLMPGVVANGLLIRHDEKDFVFKTSETEGIQITQEEVDGLSNMLARLPGGSTGSTSSQGFDWERVEETGESAVISGYPVQQLLVHEPDSGNWISVWLTDQIKVNWGILNETWKNSTAALVQSDLPIEVFMNRNSFPLLIEYYREGERVTIVEAVDVRRQSVDSAQMDLPGTMRLTGISDLVMRMMMERR
ncbi:MAG: hypothetical protein WD355_06760 [Balneolaceae bacterium]